MHKRRLDRRISPWRYYFVNRRVANLVGFFVLLLSAVLLSSAFLRQTIDGSYLTTVYALAAVVAAYFFVERVVGRQKPRDYIAGTRR